MTEQEMRERLLANPSREQVAQMLDRYGITLVSFRDPEDGSEVVGIDWRQAIVLANEVSADYARMVRRDGF